MRNGVQVVLEAHCASHGAPSADVSNSGNPLHAAMSRSIRVVPHEPHWARLFAEEAKLLRAVFGDELVAIHHIGSTAIPSISAKPIIDILMEVRDIEKVDGFNASMRRQGYEPKGEFGIPGRRYFRRGSSQARTHHVHAFQTAHPEVGRHLAFRDYLIAHPPEAQAYGRLKEMLARQCGQDRESYTNLKSGFIQEMDRRARAWREARQARPSVSERKAADDYASKDRRAT